MTKDLKIALAVIAVAALVCIPATIAMYTLGGPLLSRLSALGTSIYPGTFSQGTYTDDRAQAARIGHSIVDYELPAGYVEQGAVDAYGYRMVTIGPHEGRDRGMTIMLMQQPPTAGMGQDEMLAQDDDPEMNMSIVGTRQVTLRGQAVTLTISESAKDESQGEALRQVTGTFRGKGSASVMLMAMGMANQWDDAVFDAFIASIR